MATSDTDTLINTLKTQIITALKLSDVKPTDIDADAPLVGGGLGLDSIDTLELLVLLEKEYGVTVPDINIGKKVFGSVRSLATYIQENRSER
jgi:acyl carrier protein